MTQIWPDFGEAPVPTLLSTICKPEAVVMGFPAVWADAIVETIDVEAAAAAAANAVWMIVRREDLIWRESFSWRQASVAAQYPSAQPSLRGSEPPVSVPLSQSIQIAWPPPSGPTTPVVLCPSFFRPSTTSAGTPSSRRSTPS